MGEVVLKELSSPRGLDVRGSAAWLRRFAGTTPGVVGLVVIAVAAVCVTNSASHAQRTALSPTV